MILWINGIMVIAGLLSHLKSYVAPVNNETYDREKITSWIASQLRFLFVAIKRALLIVMTLS